jgi:hypothetical protein
MSFLNRSREDQLLFVYVTGVQDAMRTISDERAIERFVQKFGSICEDCTVASLRLRLIRMRKEYNGK